MSPIPFDPEKVTLTLDDERKVRNIVEYTISPIENDMKDMKGNMKDIIFDAVLKALRAHQKENCDKHKEQTAANTKRIRVHDWWLWILSGAVAAIILKIIIAL
jgi:hypothetical protein